MIRIFGHYIDKHFLLLGLLEFMLFYACLLGGYLLRSGVLHDIVPITGAPVLHSSAMLYAMVLSGSLISMGLYQRGLQGAPALLVRLGISFFLASMVLSLLFYLFPALFLGRGALGSAMLLSVVGVLLLRGVYFRVAGRESQRHRVLVLGTGINAARILRMEESAPQQLGFSVASYVNLESSGPNVVPEERQVEFNGSLLELAKTLEISEIVVAVDDRRKGLPIDDILDCKMAGIVIYDLLTFFEKETSRIAIDLLHPSWIYYSPGFCMSPSMRNSKRALDLAASLLMMVAFSPFFVLVTLASLIESLGRDPIFYSQTRIGLNGRPFRVHKFRSMRADAEADGVARWATSNDSRVTALGAFLRKTRLDEIPQLFNVLRGDMSLVGPRPERPEFVTELERQIPYYRERHRMRPGLTGWAQLRYPYGATVGDAKQKLQYDLYYVKNANIFLDLVILLETVEVVLMGKGAR